MRRHSSRWNRLLTSSLVLAAISYTMGCSGTRRADTTPVAHPSQTAGDATRIVSLLTVNDIYRIEGVDEGTAGGLARLRTVRADLERRHPDLLLLHAGDFLFPSLLSDAYDGAHMIDLMNLLDADASGFDDRFFVTFGNHEFDKAKLQHAPLLTQRIDASQFVWLATDIEWQRDPDSSQALVASNNLRRSAIVDAGGVRVGLFSISTEEKFPEYVAEFADPVTTARRALEALRSQGAEVVIALTHQAVEDDLALIEALPAQLRPDVVIGGHEHQRTERAANDGTLVLKADADGRSAVFVQLLVPSDEGAEVEVRHEFLDLDLGVEVDPQLEARTDQWLERHQREYCAAIEQPPGCLDVVVGQTAVRLRAEETEIRRFETNLGNWVADQARAVFPQADVALINSGSLRLNQDIPAGAIRARALEELFAYPNKLVAMEIDGRTLRQALLHGVREWTGSGAFLQVSGVAFRFDPQASGPDRVRDITLLAPGRPLAPDDRFTVVTWDFLQGGGDGYTMWTDVPVTTSDLDMAQHIRGLLERTTGSIAPRVEGRICNTTKAGPCLAVTSTSP